MNRSKKVISLALGYLLTFNCFFAGIESATAQTEPFTVLKNSGYKHVSVLKTKKAEYLGDIYIKENSKYTNHVLAVLLIVKAHGARLDTLYQINAGGDFINAAGKVEDKNTLKHYYGFKLITGKKPFTDFVTVGLVDSKGTLYADDNNYLIDWDYKSKKFVYDPAP